MKIKIQNKDNLWRLGLIIYILFWIVLYIVNEDKSNFWVLYSNLSLLIFEIANGALFLWCIQKMVSAKWSDQILPYFENFTKLIPISSISFIISLLGSNYLFPNSMMHLLGFKIFTISFTIIIPGIFIWQFLKFQKDKNIFNIYIFGILYLFGFIILSFLWYYVPYHNTQGTMIIFSHLAISLLIPLLMISLLTNHNLDISIRNYLSRYILAIFGLWLYTFFAEGFINWYADFKSHSNFNFEFKFAPIALISLFIITLLLFKQIRINVKIQKLLSALIIILIFFAMINFKMKIV